MLRRSALCLVGALLAVPLLALVGPPPADARADHPLLRSSGSRATFAVDGGGRIRVDARSARCRGHAVLRLYVDGRLDRTIKLTRYPTKRYVSTKSYAAKRHRVVVILRKDKKVTRRGKVVCNRQARVMRVSAQRPADTVGAGAFTLAVIGDTQGESVTAPGVSVERTRWLASRARALDLRFVAHTGDLTNWGWVRPAQYSAGRTAIQQLTAAGVPWQVSAGNHDTRVVGWDGIEGSRNYGGAAYVGNPECRERMGAQCASQLLVRRTEEFTTGLPGNPSGGQETGFFAYDSHGGGRPDNSFATFTAEGRRWLVLNLELWPRPAVVQWARDVVGSHPSHNVIVQTHSYLRWNGTVDTSNGGYGSTPGTYLEQHLISAFPNIKIVLSGHMGVARHRVDQYGRNRVVAFLGNDGSTAVTRLVNINVRRGTVTSRYWTDTANLSTAPSGTTRTTGLSFR